MARRTIGVLIGKLSVGQPAQRFPTAVHCVADVHETPFRAANLPSDGGVVWIDQVVPFQTSAKVCVEPLATVRCPIASQAVAEVHDTMESAAPRAEWGTLGVVWVVQLVPSQRSACVPFVSGLP